MNNYQLSIKNYQFYKDSGVAWLGDVPEHWEVKRLKDLSYIQNSNVDKKSYVDEIPVKLCNYVDVYKNEFINSSLNFMNATATKSEIKQFVINEGDVFITKDSETCEDIAIPAIATESLENVICGYHLAQFRTKEKIFLGSYLFRLFQSKSYGFRFVISAKGITRVGLGQSAIADSLTPVPPISEQRSIATYLDTKTAQCDRKIDLLTQKATQYGKLKQSLINETVTRGLDKSVPMKDIGVEWIGEVPEHWEIKRHKDNFIFVNKRCSDATFLKVGLENIESKTGQFLSTESEFDGDGIEFRENDILFGKLRPYLAKVYLAKFNGNAIGDIFVYRTKLNTQSKFANYLMLSSRYIDVMNSSTVGAKMPRVSSDFIANLIVATPPLSEQKAIADYLDTKTAQIDQIIQTINAQIEKLKELRKTLINDVVTGKIKVIDNGELKMDNY